MTDETEVGKVKNVRMAEVLDIIVDYGEEDVVREIASWLYENNEELSALADFIASIADRATENDLNAALDGLMTENEERLKTLPDKDAESILQTLVDYYFKDPQVEEVQPSIAKVFLMSPDKAIDLMEEKSESSPELMLDMIKQMFRQVDN